MRFDQLPLVTTANPTDTLPFTQTPGTAPSDARIAFSDLPVSTATATAIAAKITKPTDYVFVNSDAELAAAYAAKADGQTWVVFAKQTAYAFTGDMTIDNNITVVGIGNPNLSVTGTITLGKVDTTNKSARIIGFKAITTTGDFINWTPDGCSIDVFGDLYATVGIEFNLYFAGIISSKLPLSCYEIDVVCAKGTQDDQRFYITPASGDVGTTAFSVSVFLNGCLVAKKTSNLIVSASASGSGVTRKVLVIGDSTTAAGTITQTLLDNADTYTATPIGTQGTPPNKHEGHGGFESVSFAIDGSPFWIGGALDFHQYLIDNSLSLSANDWIVILTGINDCGAIASDTAMQAQAKSEAYYLNVIIGIIKAEVSGIRIAIGMVIPPAAEQASFGALFGAERTQKRHAINRSIWRKEIYSKFKDRDGVEFIHINGSISTEYGFPATAGNVATRITTQITRQTDGYHPTTGGYSQMGDCLWSFLKSKA